MNTEGGTIGAISCFEQDLRSKWITKIELRTRFYSMSMPFCVSPFTSLYPVFRCGRHIQRMTVEMHEETGTQCQEQY